MGQYTQLSVTDRRRIFVFLEMGLSIREITLKLNRHRSTIYRELNRNNETGVYLPVIAHQKALGRVFKVLATAKYSPELARLET